MPRKFLDVYLRKKLPEKKPPVRSAFEQEPAEGLPYTTTRNLIEAFRFAGKRFQEAAPLKGTTIPAPKAIERWLDEPVTEGAAKTNREVLPEMLAQAAMVIPEASGASSLRRAVSAMEKAWREAGYDIKTMKPLAKEPVKPQVVTPKEEAPLLSALENEGEQLVKAAKAVSPDNPEVLKFEELLGQAKQATTPKARREALRGMEALEEAVRGAGQVKREFKIVRELGAEDKTVFRLYDKATDSFVGEFKTAKEAQEAVAKGVPEPQGLSTQTGGLGGLPPPPRRPTDVGEFNEPIRAEFPQRQAPDYSRIEEALHPELPSFAQRFKKSWEDTVAAFFDPYYQILKLEKQTGVPAYTALRLVAGAVGEGEAKLYKYFRPILQKAEKAVGMDNFEKYLIAKRTEDLVKINPNVKLPAAKGLKGERYAQNELELLHNEVGALQFQEMEQLAAEYWRTFDYWTLGWLEREGVITTELANAMRTKHPHYISFQRRDYLELLEEATSSRGGVKASVNTVEFLRRMAEEGSELGLKNPLASSLTQITRTARVIARNQAAREGFKALHRLEDIMNLRLVKYTKWYKPTKGAAQQGETIIPGQMPKQAQLATGERTTSRAIPEGDIAETFMPGGKRPTRAPREEYEGAWGTISYRHKGQLVEAEVPLPYKMIVETTNAGMQAAFNKIAKLHAPFRQAMTTYSPGFFAYNIIRDGITALFREHLIPFSPSYIRGWVAAATKNPLFFETMENRALMSGLIETMSSRTETQAVARSIGLGFEVHSPADVLKLLVKRPGEAIAAPFKAMENLNVIGERATRIAVYDKLTREGVTVPEAALRARSVTVDFSLMGTAMRYINAVFPFSNAAVQAATNVVRTILKDPKQAILWSLPFEAISLVSHVNNLRFKSYDTLDERSGMRYWRFIFGEYEDEEGKLQPLYIKIPKGELGAALTAPAELIVRAAQKADNRSIVEFLWDAGKDVVEAAAPLDTHFGSILPPIGQTIAGIATGKDPWTGLDIVPKKEQALLPEQQFGQETSALVVLAGKTFKVSPRMIEWAIQDFVGGVSQNMLWFADMGLKAIGIDPTAYGQAINKSPSYAAEVARTPILGRFLGAKGTQEERMGYEAFHQANDDTNRQFAALPLVEELGVRLGTVGDTVQTVPLTPRQRAEYQQMMANAVIPVLQGMLSDPYFQSKPPEWQRSMIMDTMRKVKAEVSDQYLTIISKEYIEEQQGGQ